MPNSNRSLGLALTACALAVLGGCGEDTVSLNTTPAPTPAATSTVTPSPTPTINAVDRANALLAQLTLDEKIGLAADGVAGVARLGIPRLVPSDGPNGVPHKPTWGPGNSAVRIDGDFAKIRATITKVRLR